MLTRVQLATHLRLLAQGSARRRRVLAFAISRHAALRPRGRILSGSSAYLDVGLSAQVQSARFHKSVLGLIDPTSGEADLNGRREKQ
jgi:hypothetical protein